MSCAPRRMPAGLILPPYDLRAGAPVREWRHTQPMGMAKSVYLTPQAARLNQAGGDAIIYGALAVDDAGQQIWRFDVGGISVLSALHAATAADLDPERPGLEVVYSIYAPRPGKPSLVTYGAEAKGEVWRSSSPHAERHPHQHAVGDFDPSRLDWRQSPATPTV